jgi:hypothetical protein
MTDKTRLKLIQEPNKPDISVEHKIREMLRPGGQYVFRKTLARPEAVDAIAENGEELALQRHPKRIPGIDYVPAFFSGTLMERYLQAVDHFATKYEISHVIYFLAENVQQRNEPHPELASRPAMHCIRRRDGRLEEYFDLIRGLNEGAMYRHLLERERHEEHKQSTLIEFLHDMDIPPLLNHQDFRMIVTTDELKTILDNDALPYE